VVSVALRRALTVAPLATASAAWACPVCFGNDAASLRAYWWSTLFLSLLPFAVMVAIGGAGWLLMRRSNVAPPFVPPRVPDGPPARPAPAG
jgi:hypothetical protein